MLVELTCTRSNKELWEVKEAYKAIFDRDLVSDVKSDTSGVYRKFLVRVLRCRRDESGEADEAGRRFEVLRVKNTHHRDAVIVGGYRDIKLLGKFSAPGDLGMIVEIQVIDKYFVETKKFMHKPFTIVRGDFYG